MGSALVPGVGAAIKDCPDDDLSNLLSSLSPSVRNKLERSLQAEEGECLSGTATIPSEVLICATAASGAEMLLSCPTVATVDNLKDLVANGLKVHRSQVLLLKGSEVLDSQTTVAAAGIIKDGLVSYVISHLDGARASSLLRKEEGSATPKVKLKLPVGMTGTPAGCTFLSRERLAVSTCYNDQVHVFDVAAQQIVSSFGGGVLKYPHGICYCHATQTVYVADKGNNRVAAFSSSTFEFTVGFRAPGLSQPYGVAVTLDGKLLAVTDYDTNYCHVILLQGTPGESQKRATICSLQFQGDSVRFPCTFYAPSGIAFAYQDSQIIVSDMFHDRIVMFDAATLQILWERPVPRALNPGSILVAGDKIIVIMSKRSGKFGTKCSVFEHPACPTDPLADEWVLLRDDIDNEDEIGGLALWSDSDLALIAGKSKEVLVFQ